MVSRALAKLKAAALMLQFKDGVRCFGICPEILYAIDRCVDIFPVDVVVTSGRGDKHSRQSLHYTGNAVDLRTRTMNAEQIREVILSLRETMGNQFDVMYETNHIHIEFQPKDAHDYLTKLAT